MIIKLILFLLFFLWVIKAPSTYRESIRAKVTNSDPAILLRAENQKTIADLVKACQLYKPGDQRRTEATCDLASIRAQQLNFVDAESLYRAALSEHKTSSGYDQYFTELMLNLATILTEQQKIYEASSYYGKVHAYDKKFLDKTDPRIARDYNNIGLNTYLDALSKDRGPERTELLKESNYSYDQALQIYRTRPKMERAIAVVLYNQHLALRDMGDETAARLVKAESEKIESKLGRTVKAP